MKSRLIKKEEIWLHGLIKNYSLDYIDCKFLIHENLNITRVHYLEFIIKSGLIKFNQSFFLNYLLISFYLEEKENITKICFLLEKIKSNAHCIRDQLLLINLTHDIKIQLEEENNTVKNVYMNYKELAQNEIQFEKMSNLIQKETEKHFQF